MLSIQPATQTERYTLPRIYFSRAKHVSGTNQAYVWPGPYTVPCWGVGTPGKKGKGNNFGHGTLSAKANVIGPQPQRKMQELKEEQSGAHEQVQLQPPPTRAAQLLPTIHPHAHCGLKQRRKIPALSVYQPRKLFSFQPRSQPIL